MFLGMLWCQYGRLTCSVISLEYSGNRSGVNDLCFRIYEVWCRNPLHHLSSTLHAFYPKPGANCNLFIPRMAGSCVKP